MFGHDDKEEKQKQADDDNVVQPMSTTPPDENLVGIPDDSTDDTTVSNQPDDEDGDISKIVDDINDSADKAEEVSSDEPMTVPISEPEEDKEETPAPTISVDNTPSDLVEIKKSALQELSPLLDELDQTPEAKLNILMMTIQASDDQSLIPQAFETAKKIEGKKPRAEAMLDIINEINYFTKKSS